MTTEKNTTTKCLTCGTSFIKKHTNHNYCSLKCSRAEKNKPKHKTCKHCRGEFVPYTSMDKFCSAKCRIEFHQKERSRNWTQDSRDKIKGKNNPAYRNGVYTRTSKRTNEGEKKFIQNSREIKKQMIDERGFIYCQNCDTSNSLNFESHHLIFRSEKPNHEHLHDKVNLLVSCIQCHNEFHKHKSIRNDIVNERGLALLFGADVLDK